MKKKPTISYRTRVINEMMKLLDEQIQCRDLIKYKQHRYRRKDCKSYSSKATKIQNYNNKNVETTRE